jgi:D-inositol-3-phosphate glycosyltransferase
LMSEPLHVAMLSVHTCPLAAPGGKKTGGMNVYVRDLSAELGRQGVQVDIFTRSQDPGAPRVNDGVLGSGVRVIHVPTGPEQPLSPVEIYPHLPEFVAGVQDFAEREGMHYDILHSHYWLSGWAAEQLRQSWGAPVLQMFHTLGRMKNRIALSQDQHEPELRIQVEHAVMQTADRLIAATPAERTQLMWLYGADMHKIAVIPPGVDLQHFCPMPRAEARRMIGMPEGNSLLLFVGRIEPLKGIDTLLCAIAVLKQEISDRAQCVCLAVIGGEPDGEGQADAEMARLEALRETLGVDDLVTFIGAKSQDTLQYYYSAAEMVIMPSYYESFGMVALEAMACGTPVVASEVGGLAYLIQDGVTGFHVPDRDPQELAGRIRLLLGNPDLRMEMSNSAVKYAQQYAWPRIASQIQQLYLAVLPS